MATRNVSSVSVTSGADASFLTDANALTLVGLGLGAVTAGGALFVGAAVAPSQVVGGALAAGVLCAGGEVKNRTGSYLPFLHDKQVAAPVTDTTAVAV